MAYDPAAGASRIEKRPRPDLLSMVDCRGGNKIRWEERKLEQGSKDQELFIRLDTGT